MKRITVPVEIVTSDDGELCHPTCNFCDGPHELHKVSAAWCIAYPLPDGHLSQLVSQGDRFGRCAACLAAEAKAKGEAK